MDQQKIQAKVAYGYRKAATYLGATFTHFRPVDPMDPLGNPMGERLADFDINPAFTYAAPSKYANAVYYGLFDPTGVLPGDYLQADQGTWFVAGMEPNKPTLCVRCNKTIDVRRPTAPIPSRKFYGGDRETDETPLLAGWPASVLQGTKGEKGLADLPGDSRMPWVIILVPSAIGVDVRFSDRVYDARGRKWTLSSVEQTNLGWRLTAPLTEV